MSSVSTEEIEAMLEDESLSLEDVQRKLAGDSEALAELEWLQAEAQLFEARAQKLPAPSPSNWAAVERRIEAPKPASWISSFAKSLWPRPLLMGFALAGAAAAAFLLVDGRGTPPTTTASVTVPSSLKPESKADGPKVLALKKLDQASQAIRDAELAYGSALDLLEEAYREQEAQMAPEMALQIHNEIRETRSLLRRARVPQGDMMRVDRRLLAASGNRIRSLQTTLISLQEKPQ